jgi:hypothetical protein
MEDEDKWNNNSKREKNCFVPSPHLCSENYRTTKFDLDLKGLAQLCRLGAVSAGKLIN